MNQLCAVAIATMVMRFTHAAHETYKNGAERRTTHAKPPNMDERDCARPVIRHAGAWRKQIRAGIFSKASGAI
jgi:hypothetical protein